MNNNKFSNLGFGCVGLTTNPYKHESLRLLEIAFDNGIELFDTAPIYGAGYSEKILSSFIKDKRDKIKITTKFGLGHKRASALPTSIALFLNYLKKTLEKSPKSVSYNPGKPSLLTHRLIDLKVIKDELTNSLKNLKTDYIDNYLLHEGLPSFLTDEALSFLDKMKSEGKILRIGVATNHLNLSTLRDYNGWDILQYENGIFHTESDNFIVQHPNQQHNYHSVLKGISSLKSESVLLSEIPGIMLLSSIRKNPNGKILFSTTNSKNLENNIKAIRKYAILSDVDIQAILKYAVS